MKGHKQIARTYGPDLMLRVCEDGREKGYRHFLYGGNQDVNRQLIHNLRSRFPGINIVGHWAPPVREKGRKEDEDILTMINNAEPDILWIGLGSPKQEYWMKDHRDLLEVPVMVGVGAAFDFLSGAKKQAPRWMQRSGLEWLFRLANEPGRLWRRYLIGNSRFAALLIMSVFHRKAKGVL